MAVARTFEALTAQVERTLPVGRQLGDRAFSVLLATVGETGEIIDDDRVTVITGNDLVRGLERELPLEQLRQRTGPINPASPFGIAAENVDRFERAAVSALQRARRPVTLPIVLGAGIVSAAVLIDRGIR